MIIGLYGYTDKRPVLYALMHLLQSLGDVAVISPNRHLSRLLEDHSDSGHIGNTLLNVTDLSPDEVWAEIQHSPDDFMHVIYDLRDSVAADVDLNIHVLGSEYEDGEKEFLECLTSAPIQLKLLYDGKMSKDKEAYNVQIGPEYLGIVEYIERNKVLRSLGNKSLAQALSKILCKDLSIPEKTLNNILAGRKG